MLKNQILDLQCIFVLELSKSSVKTWPILQGVSPRFRQSPISLYLQIDTNLLMTYSLRVRTIIVITRPLFRFHPNPQSSPSCMKLYFIEKFQGFEIE